MAAASRCLCKIDDGRCVFGHSTIPRHSGAEAGNGKGLDVSVVAIQGVVSQIPVE